MKPEQAVSMARAGIEIEREARGLLAENEGDDTSGKVKVLYTMPNAFVRTLDAPSPSSSGDSIVARHRAS